VPQDWFSQHAPSTSSASSGGGDWFAAHAPDSSRDEVTALGPDEEPRYRQWLAASQITDADAPDAHYDYRGLYRHLKGQPVLVTPDRHFPDTFKQHGHPTFSRESQYSRGPGDGGIWQGDRYLPPGSDIGSDVPAGEGLTWAGARRGAADMGEGLASFGLNALRTLGGDPRGARAIVGGAQDQIAQDVEGIKREPMLLGKVARAVALPLDVTGIVPATAIAEDMVRGDYAHGLAMGAGSLVLAKAPRMVKVAGQRVGAAPAVARVLTGRAPAGALPEVPAFDPLQLARQVTPEQAALAPARSRAEYMPVGEEPAAVPAPSPGRPGGDVVGRVQAKLASGETLGTPEAREAFAERQRVAAVRKGESVPLDVDVDTARAPLLEEPTPEARPSSLSADDDLYQHIRDDARANGYTGTDAQLRMEFSKRLQAARAAMDIPQDATDNGPRALLQAIADAGGLNVQHDVYGGELGQLAGKLPVFYRRVGNYEVRPGAVVTCNAGDGVGRRAGRASKRWRPLVGNTSPKRCSRIRGSRRSSRTKTI
jgi:hypothetical protein